MLHISVNLCWLEAVHGESVTATFDIDCKMFVCSFLRLDKVRRIAVEVTFAGAPCHKKTCVAVGKLLAMLLVCCVCRGCNGRKFCMHALRLSTYTRGSGIEMDFVGLTNSPGKPSLRLWPLCLL